MSNVLDAKKALGELFILGFMGTTLPKETEKLLKESGIGGILLFKHNFENPDQVRSLISSLQNARSGLDPLWLSVDQEGGRVQRFKGSGKEGEFLAIPSAKKVISNGSPQDAFRVAQISAEELRQVGVNINFAPVCDLLTNPAGQMNSIIGDRAYGQTPEEASPFIREVVRAHLEEGVDPCAKHFPGHGDTIADSHFELPRIETDLATLRAREFKPFQAAFNSGCKFVMTAHILIPAIDPEFPATLSKRILKELLRAELGFDGLIVSDDLQMQAVTDHYGVDDAPRLALQAGCDLLIYRSQEVAVLAWESLTRDLEKGRLEAETVLEAAERSKALKRLRSERRNPLHKPIKELGQAENLKFLSRYI